MYYGKLLAMYVTNVGMLKILNLLIECGTTDNLNVDNYITHPQCNVMSGFYIPHS